MVVRAEVFVGAIDRVRHRGRPPRACLRADPEQIGRCALEVAPLSIDIEVLDQPGRVPARELVVAQVRNLPAHLRLGGLGIQSEVEPDARHAFALEGVVLTRGRAQRGVLQRSGNGGIGFGERATVDLRDYLRQRHGRRGPQRGQRQQQAGNGAPDGTTA